MPPTKVEQALIDANAIMAQFVPLVGIVGTVGRGVYALLKANGLHKEAQVFADEMAAAEADRVKLGDALAEFWAKYPIAVKNEPPAIL